MNNELRNIYIYNGAKLHGYNNRKNVGKSNKDVQKKEFK